MASIEQIRSPAQYGLTVIRGDSFELAFRLVDAATGSPISLAGWTGFAAVYVAPGVDATLLELGVDVSQDAAGQPGAGLVTISAEEADTKLLSSGVWRLALRSGSSSKTVVAGEWCVVEPYAGGAYQASCGGPGCGQRASAPGSCGYSETLGVEIPCGSSSASGPSAPAVGEVTIKIGSACSC